MWGGIKTFILTVAFFIGLTSLAHTAGTTSGMLLKKNFSPRSAGMAEAYTAVADDVSSIYANPAGLTYLERGQVGADFNTGLVDDYLAQVNYAGTDLDNWSWGAGALMYSGGQFELVDNIGNQQTLAAQRDWLFTGSVAYKLAEGFRMGISAEGLLSTLAESQSASTFGVTAGISTMPLQGLRLDVVIKHLGLEMNYGNSADPLPTTAAVGLAFKILEQRGSQGHQLVVAADLTSAAASPVFYNAGAEYWYHDFFALRGGYKLNRDLESATAGAGLRFPAFGMTEMQVDYAFEFSKDLDQQHKVALTLLLEKDLEKMLNRLLPRPAATPVSRVAPAANNPTAVSATSQPPVQPARKNKRK